MIAQLVYILCALTSVGCAVLLLRGYRKNRTSLLFWSGVFFALLGVANILLFVDLVVMPEVDLTVVRTGITATAHMVLIFGLISKS